MASTAVTRGTRAAKTLPPPSPFGELLRRSNFASYDPAIRQTYAAPASYVSRGNWGLKRPIANKKRHSAIVLRQFEEHAHYIEWDKAPAQVDFVRRIEELNVQPVLKRNTPWSLSIGPDADAIDSDFAVRDWSPSKPKAAQAAPAELEPIVEEVAGAEAEAAPAQKPAKRPGVPAAFNTDVIISHLGNRGRGSYGIKVQDVAYSSEDGDTYIQPNIAAMTPSQFEEYLEELREMRPKFREYIQKEIAKQRAVNDTHTIDPEALSPDEVMLYLAAEATEKGMHRTFLGKQTESKFEVQRQAAKEELSPTVAATQANAPQPIKGQPHTLGGLLYSKPTALESHFTGHSEPGIVLQTLQPAYAGYVHHKSVNGFVAGFAGMNAKLSKEKAHNALPLFDPLTEEGLTLPLVPNASGTGSSVNLEHSERDMRVIELTLETPPKVVGAHVPNQTMLGVTVDAEVAADPKVDHVPTLRPGSREYSSAVTLGGAAKKSSLFASFKSNVPRWRQESVNPPELSAKNMKATAETIDLLKQMVTRK